MRFDLALLLAWPLFLTVLPTSAQEVDSGKPQVSLLRLERSADGIELYANLRLELPPAVEDALTKGIRDIPGLDVMGDPEMALIAFSSDEVPVFVLADAMKARGWHVQPQLAYGPSKENLHLTINPSNVRWTQEFLKDLREAVADVRKSAGEFEGTLAFAKMFADKLTGPDAAGMLPTLTASLGLSGEGKMPDKMAEINAILNALPRPLQEQLLVHFVSMLFTPAPPPAA